MEQSAQIQTGNIETLTLHDVHVVEGGRVAGLLQGPCGGPMGPRQAEGGLGTGAHAPHSAGRRRQLRAALECGPVGGVDQVHELVHTGSRA